jgi:phage gp29-like protein
MATRKKGAKDTFSDETSNPNLANVPRRPNQPTPPMALTPEGRRGLPGEEGTDFYRKPPGVNGDDLPTQPQWSINPARLWQSVRMRFNPIRGLTFERLVNYIEQWWYGYFRYAGFTWTTMMRRDYQLQICAPKRFKAAARHGFEILLTEVGQQQADEYNKQKQQQQKTVMDRNGQEPNGPQPQPDGTVQGGVMDRSITPGTKPTGIANQADAQNGNGQTQNGNGNSGGAKPEAIQQQEFLKDFYDNVTATDALNPNKEGGFALLVRQMMEAVAYYYAVHEIVWEPKEDGTLSAKFIYCPIWWFEGVRGKLRYLDSEFQVWGREMDDNEWLVTCGDGLMEAVGIIYMLKHGSLKAWVSYLDKFGMPGLLGKTHAKKDTAEWIAMKEALIEFSNEWATVIGGCAGELAENDISLIEAKNSENGKAFESLIEKLDKAITSLFRGGDLGTSSQRNSQGASLQGDESEVLETDDLAMIEERLLHVSQIALAWRFGNDVKPMAYIKLRTSPKKDFAADIAVDQFLTSIQGKLDTQETYERYVRSVPPGTPQELSAPQQQPGQGSGGGTSLEQSAMRQLGRGAFAQTRNGNGELANDKFDEAAMREFSRAYASDVQPLVERLKAIYRIEQPEVFRNRMASFLNELERVKKALGHDNEVSLALQKVLAAALANGISEAWNRKPTRKRQSVSVA